MKRGSRPGVLSVLLVFVVSFVVFASSSLAMQDVTASNDELLTEDVERFESVETSGAVKVKERRGELYYDLSFRATLRMPQVDARKALTDQLNERPDVVIAQRIRYPVLAETQTDFIGPVGLPFDSEELALVINLAGPCFDEEGVFQFGNDEQLDVKCADAKLVLGDEAFDASELLTKLKGKVWHTGRYKATVKMHFQASFADPGYPFPITSIGDGSETTVMYGPFGGTTDVRRVSFSG